MSAPNRESRPEGEPPHATASRLNIRPFTGGDVPAANALTNQYIISTAVHFALEPATDREFHDGFAAGATTYPWLAADIGGEFAGYAKAYQWRSRDAYKKTAEVGIYVEDRFHRRGVGRALYAALIDRCRNTGFHTLIAGIALPNDNSVKMHEACGFEFVGTFHDVGRKFDQWHDVGFWQLPLSRPR